jgi:hypothetical protein
MSARGPSTTSLENHTMLVQLNDAVTGLARQVTSHISEQKEVNNHLYSRIDTVQNETRRGVDEIKGSLGQSGKISPAHVAALISLMALFGGFAQFFLDTKIANITPLIDSNTRGVDAALENLHQVKNDLVHEQMDSAARHAASEEARRWLEAAVKDLQSTIRRYQP